jgi:hypothetical protein
MNSVSAAVLRFPALSMAVVLLLGWRIVPAIAGTAVVNERF